MANSGPEGYPCDCCPPVDPRPPQRREAIPVCRGQSPEASTRLRKDQACRRRCEAWVRAVEHAFLCRPRWPAYLPPENSAAFLPADGYRPATLLPPERERFSARKLSVQGPRPKSHIGRPANPREYTYLCPN